MMADPKKLPRTNLEQKIMIIDYFKRSNKPQSDTVEHFKDQFSISTSSFSEWLRHEDELRQRYMKAIDGGNGVSENLKYSKRKATFKYGPINDAMHKVVCERLSMNLPVTEPILRHYWAKFAKEYGITDPKRSDCFSHGWLANFKKRHGLTKIKKPKSTASNNNNNNNSNADTNKINNENSKNSNDQCKTDTPSLDSSGNDNNSDNCSSSGESGTGGSGSFSDGDVCNEKSLKELQLSNPTTVNVVSSTYDPITNTHRINTKRQCPHNHGKNCPIHKKRRKNIDDFDYLNANTANYTYTTYAIPANVPLHDYLDHKSSSNINSNNSNSNSITKKGNSEDNNGVNSSNFNTNLSATNKAVLKNRYKGSNSNSGTLNSLLISNNNGSVSGTSSASTTGGENIPSTGYPVMGAEYQKTESPLISASGNGNYSSSTHNANNSNNTGAHSQFDIQQILNSQISKPPVSGSSNLNINMNPVNINVLNSRLPYSHYDGSVYSKKQNKSDSNNSSKDRKASSTSPSLYNTTLNTNSGAAFQSWSNFSNLTKKHSTNFTISSSNTTTTANGSTAGTSNTGNSGIHNLLPNILSQGINLNNSSGKMVDYNTGSDVSRSSIDSNNSNRKITDITDMLDKHEQHSPPPTATTYRHNNNTSRINLPLESLADISASVLSSEISKTMKKSASSSSHKSFKLADDRSKMRFGFNNSEDVVGIDDMERLLFVYADRFFKQFKDTEGFEQSKELFDEFKTRFMADKHLYLSSSLSKENNNDNDNASSSSSSNDEEKVGEKEREPNGNGRKGYNHGVFFR